MVENSEPIKQDIRVVNVCLCVCVCAVCVNVCMCAFTKVSIRGLVLDVTIVSEDFPETEDMNTGPRIQPPLNRLLMAARYTLNKYLKKSYFFRKSSHSLF